MPNMIHFSKNFNFDKYILNTDIKIAENRISDQLSLYEVHMTRETFS